MRRVTPKIRTYCLYLTRECPCTVDLMSVLYLSTRQVITTLGYGAKSASEEVEKTVVTSPGRAFSPFFLKVTLPPFHREDLCYLCLVGKSKFYTRALPLQSSIPPHAEKSCYLRDWNIRLVTSRRQRINLPTFEGIRGLYLTRLLLLLLFSHIS